MHDRGGPSLNTSTVILGAGVSGLSTAIAWLKRGHTVTLLDRGSAGGESSWAGGGILSPLLPWDYAASFTSLALRSMAAYADWVADIETLSGREVEFWRCGMLALDVAEPEQALAWCAAHGMAAQPGVPGSMSVPSRTYPTAVWLPEVAQARNPRLVAALRGAVVKLGGVIHEHCPATAVLTRGGRVTAVQVPEKTFPADTVIMATGAWASLPLSNADGKAQLSPAPNIRPIRGQMLLFRLAPGVLDTILYRNGLYLIPRRDGHVLVGSTLEDVGFDKSTDDATLRRLHAEAAELLPALRDVQPIRHWAGLRPGSPDNIPVIDRHPDFDNVYVNAGHYRYGVTLAPASAELLADLIESKTPAVDPAPYRWQAAAQRHW